MYYHTRHPACPETSCWVRGFLSLQIAIFKFLDGLLSVSTVIQTPWFGQSLTGMKTLGLQSLEYQPYSSTSTSRGHDGEARARQEIK